MLNEQRIYELRKAAIEMLKTTDQHKVGSAILELLMERDAMLKEQGVLKGWKEMEGEDGIMVNY